jgi:hypothetical protein
MKKPLLLLAALLASTLFVSAQPGSMASAGGSTAMLKFFGNNQQFTATCAMKVADQDGAEIMSGEMKYSMLEGKLRVDTDMTKMKSKQMPPAAMASMKQMGMTEVSSIVRQDTKTMYLIYPGLESYAKMTLSAKDAAGFDKAGKLEFTKLGEETIDGHACVKNKAVFTDDSGAKREATLWNATDLKDFPVQIVSTESGNTATMTFKNISTAKPDAKLFEAPADYTAYDDMQQMMMASMQRMMKSKGGMGMPPQ